MWIDMWINTREAAERELHPRDTLNHLHGVILLGFLWPVILLCLVLNPYLVYLRILPCVRMHLVAKMDASKRLVGRLTLLPLTLKELLHAHIVGKLSLISRMRNM